MNLQLSHMYFDPVDEAIATIAAGGQVIIFDHQDRENEGDLVMAAEHASMQSLALMITQARGLICAPARSDCLDRIGIPDMTAKNLHSGNTAFAVSVDAKEGIGSGISAQDRSHTLKLLANPQSRGQDFVCPGHIFPLRARPGGVLERPGHTEATVDLVEMAGCHPVGVLCEILNADGSVARLPELFAFRDRFHLKMISVESLVHYRQEFSTLISRGRALESMPLRSGG